MLLVKMISELHAFARGDIERSLPFWAFSWGRKPADLKYASWLRLLILRPDPGKA
jgi:hypothetical protein